MIVNKTESNTVECRNPNVRISDSAEIQTKACLNSWSFGIQMFVDGIGVRISDTLG